VTVAGAATYAADVTERLRVLRSRGIVDFPEAWAWVQLELPPPGSWRANPAIGRDEGAVEFLREQCRRSWENETQGPVLNLRDLIEGMGDESRMAAHG
jgi:hypothetical protein